VSRDPLRDYLEDALALRLPAGWSERIERLHALLVEANARLNLTRLEGRDDFLWKHVADSLLVARAWPAIARDPLRVADVGCGGGFPGLPLAITFGGLRVAEIDSSRKRIAAVERFIAELGLSRCEALAARARELGRRAGSSGAFDLVLARAVGATADLVKECRRLLAPGGALILYKTPAQAAEEAGEAERAARKAGLELRHSEVLELPGGRGTRQFAVVAAPAAPRAE
jgi:16S rRNA (guanine527-N7)-methyltransferase